MRALGELAKEHAVWLQRALQADGFVDATQLSASELRASHTLVVLQQIQREIMRLVDERTGQPFTAEFRTMFLEQIGSELRLNRPADFVLLVRAAGSGDLDDVSSRMEELLCKRR